MHSPSSTAITAIRTSEFPLFSQLPVELQIQIWKPAFLQNNYFNFRDIVHGHLSIRPVTLRGGPNHDDYVIYSMAFRDFSATHPPPCYFGTARLKIGELILHMYGKVSVQGPYTRLEEPSIKSLLQTCRLSRVSALEIWRDVLKVYGKRERPRMWEPLVDAVLSGLEALNCPGQKKLPGGEPRKNVEHAV